MSHPEGTRPGSPKSDIISTTHLRLWFKEYTISKLAGGIKPSTLEGYKYLLEVYLKWVDDGLRPARGDGERLGPMDTAAVEAFMAEQRRNHSPQSVLNSFRAMATFFNWLVRRRVIRPDQSPTLTIDRPAISKKRMKYVRLEEFEQLYNSIGDTTWMMWRDRALLLILFYSGLRASEVLNLSVGDIERDEKMIFVRSGKGGKDRMVPYAPQLPGVLDNYLMRRPECRGLDHLFVASDGFEGVDGPLSYMGFVQMMRRRCARAGLPHKLNIHSFRHGFAMWALNNGVPMSALSAMMGHSSVIVTESVYARWVTSAIRREYTMAFDRFAGTEATLP
jgi:integrase